MNHPENQYLDILQDILANGTDRKGRNSMTRALFVKQMRFDLDYGFPALTTKKLFWDAVVSELLWFIKGPTKHGRMDEFALRELSGKDRTIWTDNAESEYWKPNAKFAGDLGRIYGAQWRDWTNSKGEKFDQLKDVIERLKADPYDRRLIVASWNPGEIKDMALPPCHMLFHFFMSDKNDLSLHMMQRSGDMFLGVPFNIASYALLLAMVSQCVSAKPKECILTLSDAHIYEDHMDAVKEQTQREPLPFPKLWLNPDIKDIDKFGMEDIKLVDYAHHPTIKAKMIV